MSLIREIINDKSSSDGSNFDTMIETLYTSKEKKILNELLNNHLFPDTSQTVLGYLGPETIWIYSTDVKNQEIYHKYHFFDDRDNILAMITVNNGKLNGITKLFINYNAKSNLKTEIFEGKKYNVDSVRYYRNGILHRDDGPAIEHDGDEYWYQNGRLHRDEGPAIEYSFGKKVWYQYGNRHRNNGPAAEYPAGEKDYYLFDFYVGEDRYLNSL